MGVDAPASAVSGPAEEAGRIARTLKDEPQPGRLALVDGHSLLHRAFFALPALSAPDGRPTGAVYGFLTMLLRLLSDEGPTHLAVALDRPEPTFRHQEFQAYKAQRAAMPDDLRTQVPLLRQVLAALGVVVLELAGAEADDVIGTAAAQAAAAGFDVRVVTGDRDALQLVGPRIQVLYTRRGLSEIDRMDEAAVRAKYGVEPALLVDVKALVGDTSDNYPGVPTVGEKTGCRLVASYGPVEALFDRLDEVGPPRVREALLRSVDVVRRNKRLATIRCDLPLAFEPEALARGDAAADAEVLFEQLGMRSLAPRFGIGLARSEPAAVVAETEPAADAPPAAAAEDVDAASLRAAIEAHDGVVALAMDPEADQVVVAAALVDAAGGAVRPSPLRCRGADAAAAAAGAERLVALDSKRFGRAALVAGVPWHAPEGDLGIAAYLLDAERSAYHLEDLCRQFGVPAPAPQDAAGAALATAALRGPMLEALVAHGLEGVYRDIELPLVGVLAAMEHHGMLVDRSALAALETEFAARLSASEALIHAAAGEAFNINSTQQLAQVLFVRLGLKPPKRTKTGYSTDADVLEQLAASHPLPGQVLAHRTLQKLQSTYVQALPGFIAADGRIHTTLQQTVAATGRLASHNPNLQNIPIREAVGRPIRRVFVAAPGWRFISADYSQVELRVLAHFSQDAGLLTAFREGRDIHRSTAAEVFGVDPREVTDAQRGAAKAVNFGIVYGISDFGLARQLGCPVAEARAWIARYFERYPGVRRFMDASVAQARATGVVRTLSGRMRRLPDITSRNFPRRAFAERMAMNTPIQGSAADLIKWAMLAVYAELRRAGLRAQLCLQIHDELLVESPVGEVAQVAAVLRRCMEAVGPLAVPLRVDVRAGPNWLDLEPLAADAGAAG